MSNIGEEAQNYKAEELKTVADLQFISKEMEVLEELEVKYPYKYILQNGERYKVAKTVLADIQQILLSSPNIIKFKVIRKGEGLKTNYTVIPLI